MSTIIDFVNDNVVDNCSLIPRQAAFRRFPRVASDGKLEGKPGSKAK